MDYHLPVVVTCHSTHLPGASLVLLYVEQEVDCSCLFDAMRPKDINTSTNKSYDDDGDDYDNHDNNNNDNYRHDNNIQKI